LKYGALSRPEGTLDVSGRLVEDCIEIVWTEQGGPAVTVPDRVAGFGSQLVRRTINGSLAGTINYNWTTSGAIVTLRINVGRLST
jgi:two-component sensor histidine kinase